MKDLEEKLLKNEMKHGTKLLLAFKQNNNKFLAQEYYFNLNSLKSEFPKQFWEELDVYIAHYRKAYEDIENKKDSPVFNGMLHHYL